MKKRIISLMLVVAIMMLATPVANAQVSEMDREIVLQEQETMVEPYGEFHTFFTFPSDNFTGTQNYQFTIDRTRPVKLMYNFRYANTTGTMTVYITNTAGNVNKTYEVPIRTGSVSSQVKELGTLPSGNYSVTLIPNRFDISYVSVAKIYSTEY